MSILRIAPVGALVVVSAIFGCALTTAPVPESTTIEESLKRETFTLYSDAELDPSNRCDIHTVLTLSPGPEGKPVLRAHLFDEVVGDCKVRVDPDPREYALWLTGAECGSSVYGAGTTLDGRPREMTFSDHRNRVCKDAVPATIVVEERGEGGDVRTLYSPDRRKSMPRT